MASTSLDLRRTMVSTFIQTLMSAVADTAGSAGYGETRRRAAQPPQRLPPLQLRHPRRHDRPRDPRTAVGQLTSRLAARKPQGAERALTSVVAICYLLGVSTRQMGKRVESQGVTTFSKSQVSMAREFAPQVAAFRRRPLDQGPYTFVAADALALKLRENERVVNVHALIAAGVNAAGYCELLCLTITSGEGSARWLTFFRDLVVSGLPACLLAFRTHRSLKSRRASSDNCNLQSVSTRVCTGG
ncbi:transposase [Nocardia tengchongensis]